MKDIAHAYQDQYSGPEILEKIVNADLVMSQELKCMDNKANSRFAYKFNPLPLNPTINSKKRRQTNAECVDSMKVDGVVLHNAMNVIFHPFL